ncbi:MAG: hypothetical protein WBX25_30665 [Rhodomicrobium sp.]
MPTERDLIQQYKTVADASKAALVRFLGECFTEALLVREHVPSSALAAHFARKLNGDEKAAELQAVMVQEFLKSWVEHTADKIARGRRTRFTEKREGSEIFDNGRLALRDKEVEETRKKVEAWKKAEQRRLSIPMPSDATDTADGMHF